MADTAETGAKAPLPPGMVLGPDGKPCRSCTAFRSFANLPKKKSAAASAGPGGAAGGGQSASSGSGTAAAASSMAAAAAMTEAPSLPEDCPPDVERLGRHTWTFLHTTISYFAPQPTQHQKSSMLGLLKALPTLYPCGSCAGHLQEYMKTNPPDNAVQEGREALELWLCKVHNEVNQRLGKDEFDCSTVSQRWREGWPDGRCD
ncbi:hypothetical protein JCM8202_000395 [Rhodotorula sphaerocarpa]